MEVYLEGTAGSAGWPAPGCGCASCGRLAPGHRRPTSIVLDRHVRLSPSMHGGRHGDTHNDMPGDMHPDGASDLPDGYRMALSADGYEMTGPDGGRVLYAPQPFPRDDVAEPYTPEPFDLVLIDLLGRPEHLGDLRRRGLVTARTQVIAVDLDHRVASENELARRLAFWQARAVPDGTVLNTTHPAPDEAIANRPRRTLLLGGSRSGKSEEAELRVAGDADVTYVATGPSGGDDVSWLARVRAHQGRRPPHWHTVETTDLAAILAEPPGTLLIDGIGTWLAAVFDECGAWPGDPDPAAPRRPDGVRDMVAERGDQLVAERGDQLVAERGDQLVAERCDQLVAERGDQLVAERGDQLVAERGDELVAERGDQLVAERCDELVAAWRRTAARVVAVSDEVGLGVIPATASGRVFRDALGRLNQHLARESEDVALVVAGRLLPLPV